MKKAFLLLSVVLAIYSCSDDPVPTNQNNTPVEVCDTLSGATYNSVVGNILTTNCSPCHTSNSASGINVANYSNAKASAEQSRFLKAIKHQSGAAAMPQGGPQLPQSDINKIECWIVNGFPES